MIEGLKCRPTFRRIIRSRSTEDFSGLPYVCTVFNCALWLLYGLPFVTPHSVLVLTINAFGFALELGYLAIFIAFAARKNKVSSLSLCSHSCVSRPKLGLGLGR